MASSDLLIRLDQDLFKGDIRSLEELKRRCDMLSTQIYAMMVEIQGSLVANQNTTTTGNFTLSPSGEVWVTNATGGTSILKYVNGSIKAVNAES